ncbi:hypothetical protein AB6A40_006472 [Gnathostoma spinigerum]|uniref:RNA-binding protein n=1 Tax=Gnathostoma spinigerum TaxID=75299 RepID=A0ABD6EIG0_9BILA
MNGYQTYYRNNSRYDRIDQEEVPESKHTLFIRGLPGHIKTDEIKLKILNDLSLFQIIDTLLELDFSLTSVHIC